MHVSEPISFGLPTREPASIICGEEQGDYFILRVHTEGVSHK